MTKLLVAALLLFTTVIASWADVSHDFADGPIKTDRGHYADKNGRILIPIQREWQDWCPFSQQLAAVQIGGKWGFINNRGRLVIPPRFDPPMVYTINLGHGPREVIDPVKFTQGLAAVSLNGKVGFIDRAGQFAIAPRFSAALPFSEGFAPIREAAGWGYIDSTGKVVVAPQYEFGAGHSEGLAAVRKNGLIGFIDTTGRLVIPHAYVGASRFRNGMSEVRPQVGENIIIDRAGNKVGTPGRSLNRK